METHVLGCSLISFLIVSFMVMAIKYLRKKPKKEPGFCIDCKHCDRVKMICVHPDLGTVDVVTGEKSYSPCKHNRHHDYLCGPSGRRFEKKLCLLTIQS